MLSITSAAGVATVSMRKQRFGKILEPMRKERSRKILEPAPSGRKPCAQPLPALLHAYPPPECSVFKSSFLINIIQGYSSFGGSPIKNGSPEPRIPQINSGSLGDPHRIPSGSHSLFRQPAALIGDQLLDAGEESSTQPLHIEGVIDSVANPRGVGCILDPILVTFSDH